MNAFSRFLMSCALLTTWAVAGAAKPLMSEDFEAGNLNAWKQNLTAGYTMTLDSSNKNAGAASLKVTNPGAKTGGTIEKEITFQSGYLRFYVHLGTGFFAQQKYDWTGTTLMSVASVDGKSCFTLSGMKSTGLNKFYLSASPGGKSWDYELSGANLTENTWYCLEFYLPQRIGSAGIRWWLDGKEQWPLGTNFSAYAQPWGKLTFGLPPGAAYSGSVNYDDIVLSDDYNGPLQYRTELPAAPAQVRDGLALDIDATTNLHHLSASWDAVPGPVTRYWYAIGSTPGGTEVLPWTDNGISLKFANKSLDLRKGTRYYVSVAAENKAGKGPVATSNGATAGDSPLVYPAITPNPIVSRNKKVYASVNPEQAAKLTDGLYDPVDPWNAGTTPSWVAIHVGPGYRKLMLIWDSIADEQFVATYAYLVRNPVSPADYTIQTSADSSDGADGTWTTVATVTNNILRCREHAFDFTGQSWVKINIEKGVGKKGVQLDEIDLYDVSKGANDTWMFFGDSITQRAYRRRPVCEQPSFAEIIHQRHPAYFPAMINGGIGGDDTEDVLGTKKKPSHTGNIDLYLEQFPDIRFWCIGFGTNDCGAKQYDPAYYKKNLQTVVDKIKAAGRIPIIAQIPWNTQINDATSPYRKIPTHFNPAVNEIIAANQLLPGPNLYDFFRNTHSHLFSDKVHPSVGGSVGMNEAWAEIVDAYYDASPPKAVRKRFFSDNSFWNQPLGPNPEIDPESESLLKFMAKADDRGFWLSLKKWTIPVYEVNRNTPRRKVLRRFLDKKDARFQLSIPYLTPNHPHGHGKEFAVDAMAGLVPIPDEARPDAEDDAHIALVDRENGWIWDMWKARRRADGNWESNTGMKYRADGSGVFNRNDFAVHNGESIHPYGPSRAAGVPIVAGLIMHHEILAGRIEHKLAFATQAAALQRFVHPPACWTDGGWRAGLPEGAVLQLDPNLDLTPYHLSPSALVVARALQTYGAVCVDVGGGHPLYAEGLYGDPQKRSWDGLLDGNDLIGIKLSHYRVMKMNKVIPEGMGRRAPGTIYGGKEPD